MPTPSPADTAPLSLTRAMVIHITLQATCRPMDIHTGIHNPLYLTMDSHAQGTRDCYA